MIIFVVLLKLVFDIIYYIKSVIDVSVPDLI